MASKIHVSTQVEAPIQQVWASYTEPKHIEKWNNASDDWHTTEVENDLQVDGGFRYRMAAKDGSASFDFSGKYTQVKHHEQINYAMTDGREVNIQFAPEGSGTKVSIDFDGETTHSPEAQQEGWQAILHNFKRYTESL